jgi:hypothetical protein
VAAGVGTVVAGELDEVDRVVDPDLAREVGEEDEARLQQRDQEQLAPLVLAGDLGPELADPRLQLLRREEDVADPAVRLDGYEARSSR